MKTLIVYSSTTGNTKAVAEYIGSKIPEATCLDASAAKDIDISGYDRVIVGSRVHADTIAKDVTSFVDRNRDALAGKESAYFLCCMFDGDKGANQCAKAGKALGMAKGAFFIGGKKLVKAGGAKIDTFIESL